MKYVFAILILLLSASVFAHDYRYVDRYGQPYHVYPTPPSYAYGCVYPCGAPPPPAYGYPHGGGNYSGWGGAVRFFNDSIGGTIYFNRSQARHVHYVGCGHAVYYPAPRTQYYNQGGSVNVQDGNVGGSLYFNQDGSN